MADLLSDFSAERFGTLVLRMRRKGKGERSKVKAELGIVCRASETTGVTRIHRAMISMPPANSPNGTALTRSASAYRRVPG